MWLAVYDNVDLADLFRTYWPHLSRRKPFITSQHYSLAFEHGATGSEVSLSEVETGVLYLLDLLREDIDPKRSNKKWKQPLYSLYLDA